jgi:hypothetical protein
MKTPSSKGEASAGFGTRDEIAGPIECPHTVRNLILVTLLTARAAHGVDADPTAADLAGDDSCTAITVGPNHEAAVQCYTQEDVSRPIAGDDMPAFRVLDHYLVRVARDHQVVTLIDVPVKSEPLDGIPLRPNAKRKPWHPFEVAADGRSIVVGDPKEAAACRNRHARDPNNGRHESFSDRVWAALDRDLEDQICDARGTYVWRNGRFRRK